MMRSDPCPARREEVRKKKSSSTLRSRFSGRESKRSEGSGTGREEEESIGMTELMHSTQLEMVQDLSHYQLVNDVWHWSTVDWGRRCKFLENTEENDDLLTRGSRVFGIQFTPQCPH